MPSANGSRLLDDADHLRHAMLSRDSPGRRWPENTRQKRPPKYAVISIICFSRSISCFRSRIGLREIRRTAQHGHRKPVLFECGFHSFRNPRRHSRNPE